jgi:putative FmdB family regulatory protein
MPTYVYECRACGKVFEADQRITEDALTDCECGAKGALRRLIQPVAVAFKGAGFHINDYAPKGAGTEGSEIKDATVPAKETPSESKPAESTPSETKSVTAKPVEAAAPETPSQKPDKS